MMHIFRIFADYLRKSFHFQFSIFNCFRTFVAKNGMMKTLPTGIQSFEDLRSNEYLYIDKTELIHQMISTGKIYFLSRPRRFGKSLLVSTLEAVFKGQKDLFEGLYIYDKWDWKQKYPVIRIDWTQVVHSSLDEMKISLVAEVKHDIKKTVDVLLKEAMNQIFNKKYYEAYLDRKVVLLAVAFTGKEVKCELKEMS
jgi:hypothetical protein